MIEYCEDMMRRTTFILLLLLVANLVGAEDLILVSPGQFEMGINPNESFPAQIYKEYTPRHKVTLTRAFQIAKTLVTFDEFYRVLNWGVAKNKLWKWGNSYSLPWFGKTIFDANSWVVLNNPEVILNSDSVPTLDLTLDQQKTLPVVGVSWYGAAEYCNLKSEMDGLSPCYDPKTWTCDFNKNGYRLPTEAEWVWAYRGGTVGKGYFYTGTDNPFEAGWFGDNCNGLMPIQKKPANELGLYDMAGDVFEWTNDWFGYFDSKDAVDPRGAAGPGIKTAEGLGGKIVLGGSWNFGALWMQPILRRPAQPGVPDFARGFRVARNAESPR